MVPHSLTMAGQRQQDFPVPCSCVIAQHKIRLQKRNWFALTESKHRSSPTTGIIFLSGSSKQWLCIFE